MQEITSNTITGRSREGVEIAGQPRFHNGVGDGVKACPHWPLATKGALKMQDWN